MHDTAGETVYLPIFSTVPVDCVPDFLNLLDRVFCNNMSFARGRIREYVLGTHREVGHDRGRL